MNEYILGVIGISKNKVIERRLSTRISQQLQLIIRSHTSNQEIQNATIENISIGGMQFSVPADSPKLQIRETCSFIFDIPHLGKSYILGEIRYCRDFIDNSQQPVIHYGVKFIKLSMKIWQHIKHSSPDEEKLPDNSIENKSEITVRITPGDETLTTRTFELIQVQIRPENTPELTGIVRDINYGGIKLQISQMLPLNTKLFIRLTFGDYTVIANGNCTWCEEISENHEIFLANISFTEIVQPQFDNLQALMMKLAAYMADQIQKSL